MIEIVGKYTKAKIFIDDVDLNCLAQIYHLISHPSFTNPVAVMPDVHQGKGSVIGFTMLMPGNLIPNIVGVDIGCAIQSMNINKLDMSLEKIDTAIRKEIPFGAEIRNKALKTKKTMDFSYVNELGKRFYNAWNNRFPGTYPYVEYTEKWLEEKLDAIGVSNTRFYNSIGTLGGGNHFIEIGHSDKSGYWVTVHTGSRNFGNKICKYWQDFAHMNMVGDIILERENKIVDLKWTVPKHELEKAIASIPKVNIPRDLAYLDLMFSYLYCVDMLFTQWYAMLNKLLILLEINNNILDVSPIDSIESIHNYIDFNDFYIRKGAIRSYVGERMVIPLNMRDGILICEGKSNPEWNYSAPHGAGRVLSRSRAKQEIDIDTFINQMEGIYSTSVNIDTLDEAPDAYKNPKVIEEAITDTAIILDRIKPILNLKDSSK